MSCSTLINIENTDNLFDNNSTKQINLKLEVKDNRSSQFFIKHNGNYYENDGIKLSDNITESFKRSISSKFNNEGYIFDDKSNITLLFEIIEFESHLQYGSHNGSTKIDISILKEDLNTIYKHQIIGTSKVGNAFGYASGAKAIKKSFDDFKDKLNVLEIVENINNDSSSRIVSKLELNIKQEKDENEDKLYTKSNKYALLIANSNYKYFSELNNPIPEAEKLHDKLVSLGFSVSLAKDATREQILNSIFSFESDIRNNGGLALFHYGGHAVQVNGNNYLIPVDADIPDERRVETRAVDVTEIMTSLDTSGSETNIIILDSCRDNPLPANTRSTTRGLAVVGRKPKNSIIVYSAESGTTAKDGVFTPILTELIGDPEMSFQETLLKVRKSVYEITNGTQIPGEYNQTFDPIYFNK